MTNPTARFASKVVAAVFFSAIAMGEASAQPPDIVDPKDELRELIEGVPASATRSKSCQPNATGAKHLHVGTPGVVPSPPGAEPPPLPQGEFRPHVFVRCALGGPGPNFPAVFFVPITTNDQAFASQVLSIVGAAHLSGKLLTIVYDPRDTSGAQIGCRAPICKLILAIAMVDPPPPGRVRRRHEELPGAQGSWVDLGVQACLDRRVLATSIERAACGILCVPDN